MAPTKRSTTKDHLGSIVAISNSSGAAIVKYWYDAWGSRIGLLGATKTAVNTYINDYTHHGFTGHQQLDDYGLIHMNGRIYDPVIGRFQTADPNVFYPESTQGFNRYTYVDKNPLSYTDPSGFGKWDQFKSWYGSHEKTFWRAVGAVVTVEAVVAICAGSYGTGCGAALVAAKGFWGAVLVSGVATVATGGPHIQVGGETSVAGSGGGSSSSSSSGSGGSGGGGGGSDGAANATAEANEAARQQYAEFAPSGYRPEILERGEYISARNYAQGQGMLAATDLELYGTPFDDVPIIGGMAKLGAMGMVAMTRATNGAAQTTVRVGELIATHGQTMSNRQLDKLAKNIRAEGIKNPLTVTEHQGKLYILDGHNRALAAPRAGTSEIPINRVELPFGAYKTPADLTFTQGGY